MARVDGDLLKRIVRELWGLTGAEADLANARARLMLGRARAAGSFIHIVDGPRNWSERRFRRRSSPEPVQFHEPPPPLPTPRRPPPPLERPMERCSCSLAGWDAPFKYEMTPFWLMEMTPVGLWSETPESDEPRARRYKKEKK